MSLFLLKNSCERLVSRIFQGRRSRRCCGSCTCSWRSSASASSRRLGWEQCCRLHQFPFQSKISWPNNFIVFPLSFGWVDENNLEKKVAQFWDKKTDGMATVSCSRRFTEGKAKGKAFGSPASSAKDQIVILVDDDTWLAAWLSLGSYQY